MKNKLIKVIVVLAACMLMLASAIVAVSAEGSKELTQNGGYRPYLEWDPNINTAGIARKNVIKVYAKAGETLNFGSSVSNSIKYPGEIIAGDIVVRRPGEADGTVYDVIKDGKGYIGTRTKELIGPFEGGYEPFVIDVDQTGIWEFEFHSSGPSKENPSISKVNETENLSSLRQNRAVAAWDVTVKNDDGEAVKGRAYVNYLALNTGLNVAGAHVVNSVVHVLTKDGYDYKVDLNGLDPYGFLFYANNRGLIDATNNTSLYKIGAGYNTNSSSSGDLDVLYGNVLSQLPSDEDTPLNITHRVFFNVPSSDLPASIPTTPIEPAKISNLRFVGSEAGKTGIGLGGTFYAEFDKATTYEILIDFNKNGAYDSDTDVILSNAATVGINAIYWDGKMADGSVASVGSYDVIASSKGGEYHFPLLDAENNQYGIKISLDNAPDEAPAGFNPNLIYYDSSEYVTANGKSVNPNLARVNNKNTYLALNPVKALDGIDSSEGALAFTSSYGDMKAVDIWTYYPGDKTSSSFDVIDNVPKFASISGYVFFDKDQNKSYSQNEMPIGSVTVKISCGDKLIEVLTDEAGHYTATIPTGSYTVEAVAPSGYKLTTANNKQSGTASGGVINLANIGYYYSVDVSVSVSVDKNEYREYDEITFTITAKNETSLYGRSVVVNAPLPANITYISDTSNGTFDYQTGIWTIGDLSANATKVIKVKAKPTKAGTYSFNGIVTAEENTDASNDNASTEYVVTEVATPVTEDYKYTITQNGSVQGKIAGSDSEGNEISFTTYKEPKNGAVRLDADGSFSYQPSKDFVGTDTFKIYVKNIYGKFVVSTVTVVLEAVVQPTVAPTEKPTAPPHNKPYSLSNDFAYIFGRSDTRMEAHDYMLSGEASAVLYRLLKQNNKIGDFEYDSSDTPLYRTWKGRWDRSALEYMTYIGAFDENNLASVLPSGAISRGDAFRLVCLSLGFTHDTELTNQDYCNILATEGYVSGYGDGDYGLDNFITRAQFCKIYNLITGRDSVRLDTKDGEEITAATYKFVDLDEDWAYEIMLKATSAYDEEGYVDIAKRAIRNVIDDYNE